MSVAAIGAAMRPAAWITMAYATVKTTTDPDLWGHLRFGLDIVRDRGLTTVDPYSFTQDLPWVNHEWLSETAMALAYLALGAYGLMVLKALLAVAALAILSRAMRPVADEIRWPVMTLGALAALPLTLTLRPQLWTWLLLAGLCRLITGHARHRWWAPALFVLWVNLHGGWIVGAGTVGAWALVRAWDEPSERRLLAGLLLACGLATLVTPYGWHLWGFIASTVRLSRAGITEWQPVWHDSWSMIILWGVGVLTVVWTVRHAGARATLSKLAPLSGLAYASLRVNRLVPLFVLAVLMLLAPYWRRRSSQSTAFPGRAWVDGGAAVAAVFFMVSSGVLPRCVAIEGGGLPDARVAAALKSAGAAGRLVTSFNWGEYALWHLGPALRVSIDGRRETLYSSRAIAEQTALEGGKGLDVLERLSPDYVWLPLPSATRTEAWLTAHGYRVDYKTDDTFLAVKGDLPIVPLGPPAASVCFPGL